jgi:LysM repeat protein
MRRLTHYPHFRIQPWRRLLALVAVLLLAPHGRALTHTVLSGESLSTIAAQYGMDTTALAGANQLGDRDVVIVGQKLTIPVGGSPFTEYKVRKGDSLGSIATRFGVSPQAISSANNLTDDDLVYFGEELLIPNRIPRQVYYTVRKGDSLASIAADQGVTVQSIAGANNVRNENLLQVGQILVIPGGKGSPPEPGSAGRKTSPIESSAITHTVRKGDVLAKIAARYGVSARAIAAANKLSDANLLRVGQVLVIPGETALPPNTSDASTATAYQIRKGDNLESIAARHGVSVRELTIVNNIRNANLVTIGQKLTIPAGVIPLTAYTVRNGETLGSIAARHRLSVSSILAHNKLPRPDRIVTGQVLLLPIDTVTMSAVRAPKYPVIPSSTLRRLDRIEVKSGQWKHVVIHHSGMPLGSGKNIDRYHREERRMENGLAYHFVIGNGNGMNEGEIYVGGRWIKQIEGGHLAIHKLNLTSIGICLIGNFEKHRPSAKQLNSLEALIRYLRTKTGLSLDTVITHKLIHPKHTLCPGRRFPTEAFINRLKK